MEHAESSVLETLYARGLCPAWVSSTAPFCIEGPSCFVIYISKEHESRAGSVLNHIAPGGILTLKGREIKIDVHYGDPDIEYE